jgi:hypothetical protein
MKPSTVERVERPAPPAKLPSLLSVDPSIVACGWAVFSGGERADELASWRYGCIRTKAHHSLQERCETICEALAEVLDGTGMPEHAVFEMPVYMDSLRGRIATRSSDLIPVAMLIGALAGGLDVDADRWHLIRPDQWKLRGASKGETREDFVRCFTRRGSAGVAVRKKVDIIAKLATSHELDSIMMGIYWLARFRATPKRKELIR